MDNKINLEEILQKNLGYSAELIKNTKSSNGIDLWKGISDSMLEFGKQLLELAAENAEMEFIPFNQTLNDFNGVTINKQSITGVINLVE